MRTGNDMRSSPQSTPNFHPEFGYLCPSGRRRGGLRLAAALVTSGMVLAGSLMLFGLADRSADAGAQILAAATIDDAQPGEIAGNPTLATMQAGAEIAAAVDAQQRSPYAERGCNDLVSSFLDHGCRTNAPRKRHAGRPGHRAATVMIGAVASPSPGAEATPLRAAGETAVASTPSIPLPATRPTFTAAATAQKPKVVQSRDLNPSRRDAAANAYARADDNERNGNRPGPDGLPFPFGGGLFGLR
jgi:hypothetical protein